AAGFDGWDDAQELAGVSTRDLARLDLARPVPPDLDLLAEVLLRDWPRFPPTATSDHYARNARQAFAPVIDPQLAPFLQLVEQSYREGRYPESLAALRPQADASGFGALRDPWGQPYRLALEPVADVIVLRVQSAGPDARWDTTDDFVALDRRWKYFEIPGK